MSGVTQKERRHPSLAAYAGGCRCDRCRTFWNRYMRRYRARSRRRGPRRWFVGRTRRVTIELTPLALEIARAVARRRRGWKVDDVVERALRENVIPGPDDPEPARALVDARDKYPDC